MVGGDDGMAQWEKTLDTKPEDLNSIPRIQVVERTNPWQLSSDLNEDAWLYACIHIQISQHNFKKNKHLEEELLDYEM